MAKPIRHIDIHRALKVVLGINYNYVWLDAIITPQSTTWFTAVQFRNDPERKWHPRITIFYPEQQTVAVLDRWGAEALVVEASTIIAMADVRAQSPQPDFTGPKIS